MATLLRPRAASQSHQVVAVLEAAATVVMAGPFSSPAAVHLESTMSQPATAATTAGRISRATGGNGGGITINGLIASGGSLNLTSGNGGLGSGGGGGIGGDIT